jgi:hypothetical protein
MAAVLTVDGVDLRSPSSRPLPPRPLPALPHSLSCKVCSTSITYAHAALSHVGHHILSGHLGADCMPTIVSRLQRLFRQGITLHCSVIFSSHDRPRCFLCPVCRSNVKLAAARIQLMATGVHTMQEINCSTCDAFLGWKIVHARNRSEKWKEGSCLLELESLVSS